MAGDDPAILANAAFALSYFGEDGGAMMALVDRALSFNSSFARGWHCSGGIRLIAGLPDLAIQHFENALRLSPRARVGWSVFGIGLGHFASKRFEEAQMRMLTPPSNEGVIAVMLATMFLVGMTYRPQLARLDVTNRRDERVEHRLNSTGNEIRPRPSALVARTSEGLSVTVITF